jgi:hypothetical protein
MQRTYERPRIHEGTAVFSADGAQVGTVTEANAGYFVVPGAMGLPTDYFIPVSAIARASGKRAELNVSFNEALASGWDRGQSIPLT